MSVFLGKFLRQEVGLVFLPLITQKHQLNNQIEECCTLIPNSSTFLCLMATTILSKKIVINEFSISNRGFAQQLYCMAEQ